MENTVYLSSPQTLRALTIKDAGLKPGKMGTLWEVGGGEQTIFGLGCSSSESDSLCLEDASIPSKNMELNRADRECSKSTFLGCFLPVADVFDGDFVCLF